MRNRLVLALALIAGTVHCNSEDPKSAERTVLVRRLIAKVSTLNPVRALVEQDRVVNQYLFTPLMRLDRNFRPIPGLATKCEVLDGGRLYRCHLDERPTFSDGKRVLASDVLFTMQKITDPNIDAPVVGDAFTYYDPARTRVVDERVIEIAFRQPLAEQLVRLADLYVLPEHVYSKGDFKNDFNDKAVGSGPYRLASYSPNGDLVLELRDDYWEEKPKIRTIAFKVLTDWATAWNALQRGDVDETYVASDTWIREHANPKHRATIVFRDFYTTRYDYIAWNGTDPLFSDKRVRRALSMCVPAEELTRTLYSGKARVVTGPFTPGSYAHNPNVKPVPYDPAEARRLLAAAGWLDGNRDGILDRNGARFEFELLVAGNAAVQRFAQTIQSELRKIGVRVSLRSMDARELWQQVMGGKYAAAYYSMTPDADPDVNSLFHSSQFPPHGQNVTRYSNPEADQLIEAARTELDFEKRKALYWKLHEVLTQDQPYTWTIQASMKWAHRTRLRGVEVSPLNGISLWHPGELAWSVDEK
jgi:peptide/nickel transport system substrate-binding protein